MFAFSLKIGSQKTSTILTLLISPIKIRNGMKGSGFSSLKPKTTLRAGTIKGLVRCLSSTCCTINETIILLSESEKIVLFEASDAIRSKLPETMASAKSPHSSLKGGSGTICRSRASHMASSAEIASLSLSSRFIGVHVFGWLSNNIRVVVFQAKIERDEVHPVVKIAT